MRESLTEYCTQYGREDLLAQWHAEKNGFLMPEAVSYGSQKKVWWRCVDGHEWKAVIYSRTGAKKSGCPVCAGRVAARH